MDNVAAHLDPPSPPHERVSWSNALAITVVAEFATALVTLVVGGIVATLALIGGGGGGGGEEAAWQRLFTGLGIGVLVGILVGVAVGANVFVAVTRRASGLTLRYHHGLAAAGSAPVAVVATTILFLVTPSAEASGTVVSVFAALIGVVIVVATALVRSRARPNLPAAA